MARTKVAFGSLSIQGNRLYLCLGLPAGSLGAGGSNESEKVRVWPACRSFSACRFDDLTISHSETILVQATDYGVWGDVLREQKTDETIYRYGYQGQFAEKDEETGWSHFELREYDAVIGRWTAVDPRE